MISEPKMAFHPCIRIEADNMIGESVEIHFTRRPRRGVWEVKERKIVGGIAADDSFYEMDSIEGRDRLAAHGVSPDMIPQR